MTFGAYLLSLSSSAEYSNNLIDYVHHLLYINLSPALSSIMRHRLMQSDIGRLEILPCNQLRNASARILNTSILCMMLYLFCKTYFQSLMLVIIIVEVIYIFWVTEYIHC